jgi:hypothetical protein
MNWCFSGNTTRSCGPRDQKGGYPLAMFAAPTYPGRIPWRCYQYRSPDQIDRWLRTRCPPLKPVLGSGMREIGLRLWRQRPLQSSLSPILARNLPRISRKNARSGLASLKYGALDLRRFVMPASHIDFGVRASSRQMAVIAIAR